MGPGLLLSLLFHLAIALVLVLGLVRFGQELPVETAVSVEVVMEDAPAAPPAPAPPAAAAPLPERVAASPPPPPAPEPQPAPPEPQPAPEPPPPPPPTQARPQPPAPAPEPEPERLVATAAPDPPPAPRPVPRPERTIAPVAQKAPEPAKPEPTKPEATKPEPPKAAPRPAPPLKPAAPKPAAEPEESDFAALLRSVERLDRRVQAPETRAGRGVAAQAGTIGSRPDAPAVAQISASQLAAMISRQVTPCWRIPIGAQGAGGMRAEVNILMSPDGNVQAVIPLDEGRIAGDPVFRAFAESAVRAVRACSPLKLPPESYAQWRNVIFNFDPSMLAG